VRQLLAVLGAADDDAVAAHASLHGGRLFSLDDYRFVLLLVTLSAFVVG
jgi:hypothetical protein